MTTTLTVQDIEHRVVRRVGKTLPSGVSFLSILNEAGRWLTSCHNWKWRERVPVTLDLAATQSYVILPDDFGEIQGRGVFGTNGLVTFFRLVDMTTLQEFRTMGVLDRSWSYIGCIAYPSAPVGGPPPRPRLEIWPAPDADMDDALTLIYRAGWVDRTANTDHFDLPSFMESLLVEAVTEFFLGNVEWAQEKLSDRLAALMGGGLFQTAMLADGRIQSRYGAMRGGMVEAMRHSRHQTASLRTLVQDPS
jgi:hypothetical protein